MALFADARFMQYSPAPPFIALDQANALIARDIQSMAAGERIRLGIERQADQALIGICTLFNLDSQCRSAEIGYGLLPAAWGQGYMHEAMQALLHWGFSDLALNRVEAEVDPTNVGSVRTVERLGFVKEGHLRESCVVKGVLADSARYGLLQREWAQR